MSSYIVENEVIDRVVSWIDLKHKSHDNWLTRQLGEELSYNLDDEHEISRLAQSMFWLNVEAVNERYGEGEAASFRPLDYEYHFTIQTGSIYQVLKSLKSWLYQCSEGDVPTTPLYKTMRELAHEIADTIVSNSPHYEKATW